MHRGRCATELGLVRRRHPAAAYAPSTRAVRARAASSVMKMHLSLVNIQFFIEDQAEQPSFAACLAASHTDKCSGQLSQLLVQNSIRHSLRCIANCDARCTASLTRCVLLVFGLRVSFSLGNEIHITRDWNPILVFISDVGTCAHPSAFSCPLD